MDSGLEKYQQVVPSDGPPPPCCTVLPATINLIQTSLPNAAFTSHQCMSYAECFTITSSHLNSYMMKSVLLPCFTYEEKNLAEVR